ncbi:proline--tRNA ligase [Paenibacillus sp. P96]|uniref:Proline--tRNA ligase n=1 Tax=Paenibacillus zeirhizosphaerae TaxID=2987519 RepID=A0ABT9FLT4_9BACL|nr:proline--tRNA ligase [Paenibacillus sp. P96]MDP4095691.1 proline--tRNA ligase [Paenibacillus sp. P96]
MRQTRAAVPTWREAPAEAESAGHRFLLRSGMIRQLAAGVFTYLPLGFRVLTKISAVIREELNHAGAQEMLMPALQPAELWQASGRYEVYGSELIRLKDRHNREFALGPTHEEVITSLIKQEISSYRQLPVAFYQIQTKFRDERRPRSGLLRGREFLMMDAYSFHDGYPSLDTFYEIMHDAYERIFTRCGLEYRGVEADAGAIGGQGGSHEFIVLSDIGEDTIAVCGSCGYAANLEKAEVGLCQNRGEEDWSHEDKKPASSFIKTILYNADGQAAAVLVRGDREVNEIKVKQALGVQELRLAEEQEITAWTGTASGFSGPVGLAIPLLVDQEVACMSEGIAGANEEDIHLRGVRPGRDFSLERTGDYRNAVDGDACPCCNGVLTLQRGIEIGHIFKLGDKYTSAFNAEVLQADGQILTPVMGCYGIGVSRLMAAVAEQCHDEYGLIWPEEIAPFRVHIIPVTSKDALQMQTAEKLYQDLSGLGVEVLLDDRDERPGVKFNDADLFGIPWRIVVGKGVTEGRVEVRRRGTEQADSLPVDEAVRLVAFLTEPTAK